jgi:restriction endonuclease S subunit
MRTKLNEIAAIQTGIYAKTSSQGDAIYLQSRHINDAGQIDKNLQTDIAVDEKISKSILTGGDILFSAKGNKNISVVYESNIGPAVASSTFFVIRLTRQTILPQYLSWFLNHPRTQKYLKAQAKGASPPSISIKTLYDLEIEIPNIDTQREIIRIDVLRKKEQSLIQQIEDLKEQVMQFRLYNSTNN